LLFVSEIEGRFATHVLSHKRRVGHTRQYMLLFTLFVWPLSVLRVELDISLRTLGSALLCERK